MKIDEKLSASGCFTPDPHQGLCPWTLLGALPQTPYRLALHALAMVRLYTSLWQIVDPPLRRSLPVVECLR